MVRSTLPNISESGTPSGLRGTLNDLVDRKVSIFRNGEEYHAESNESLNIDLICQVMMNYSILSQNEHRDDPEKVV